MKLNHSKMTFATLSCIVIFLQASTNISQEPVPNSQTQQIEPTTQMPKSSSIEGAGQQVQDNQPPKKESGSIDSGSIDLDVLIEEPGKPQQKKSTSPATSDIIEYEEEEGKDIDDDDELDLFEAIEVD